MCQAGRFSIDLFLLLSSDYCCLISLNSAHVRSIVKANFFLDGAYGMDGLMWRHHIMKKSCFILEDYSL